MAARPDPRTHSRPSCGAPPITSRSKGFSRLPARSLESCCARVGTVSDRKGASATLPLPQSPVTVVTATTAVPPAPA
eukprot:362619-Chlamydomonas_euryale.AAC.6